jgi:hypothetical protein
MFVALLMVGCGEEPGGDSSESNQSSVETPSAKTAEVAKIDLNNNETCKKIIAEAVYWSKLEEREKGSMASRRLEWLARLRS